MTARTGRVAAAVFVSVLTAVLIVTMLACWFAAIWAHGYSMQDRLANTGLLLFFVNLCLTLGSYWVWLWAAKS